MGEIKAILYKDFKNLYYNLLKVVLKIMKNYFYSS